MKIFPTAFEVEKNKAVGAKPIWILKLTINSTIYWLSGKAFNIKKFQISSQWPSLSLIRTSSLVKQWGSINQGITNWLSEFQVSELSLSLLLKSVSYVEIHTNFLLQSNDLTTSPWADAGTGTCIQGAVDPDGGSTAWTLNDTSASNMYYIFQPILLNISTTYTASLWCAKKSTPLAKSMLFQFSQLPSPARIYGVIFNPYSGSFVTTLNNTSFENITVELVGNFWKIELTFTTETFNTASEFRIAPAANSDGSSTVDITTTGSNVVYGIQIQAGDVSVGYNATTTTQSSATTTIPAIDLEPLLITYPIEEQPVELYEWFIGCSDPPQRLFSGYVRDMDNINDLTVNLSIQDDTIKLEKHYVGTKLTQASYPTAASADIGKVIPIPFGTVSKCQSLVLAGYVQTTLTGDVTLSATSFNVSDVTGIAIGQVYLIDSEQVCVTGVTGGTPLSKVLRINVSASGTTLYVDNTTGVVAGQIYTIGSENVHIDVVNNDLNLINSTTLSSNITSADTTLYVDSVSTIFAGQKFAISSEIVYVVATHEPPIVISHLLTEALGTAHPVASMVAVNQDILQLDDVTGIAFGNVFAIEDEQVRVLNAYDNNFSSGFTLVYSVTASQTTFITTKLGSNAPTVGQTYLMGSEQVFVETSTYSSGRYNLAVVRGYKSTTAASQSAGVTGIVTNLPNCRVNRAYNGTTAVAHSSGTTVTSTDRTYIIVTRGYDGTTAASHLAGDVLMQLNGPNLSVTRGYNSTSAVAHSAGSILTQYFGASIYINVSRHYNSTTAVAHTKGTTLVQLTTQTYCCSDRSLTSMGKVWLRLSDDNDMDISAYCNKYYTNNLPVYSKSGITITSAQMVSILSIIGLKQSDTIGVSSSKLSLTEAFTNGPQYSRRTTSGYQSTSVFGIFSNSEANNRNRITLTIDALFSGSSYDAEIWLNSSTNSASRVQTLWSENSISGDRAMNFSVDIPSPNCNYNYIECVISSSNMIIEVRLNGATRVITQTASSSTTTGARVDKTGSAQLTGSAMTTYFGSGKVFIDLVSDKGNLVDMCDYILDDADFTNNISTVGTLPVLTRSGAITEYTTALWWLNHLALQSQAWFTIINGLPKLVSRSRNIVDKTISACKITEDGQRVLTRRKTDSSEVINKINLLYNRDWSKSKGDSSYKSNLLVESTASQTTYGLKEQTGLFQFDFMTSLSDATDTTSFYIANYKDRHWIAEFDVFLDNSELEFGDCVQLGFIDTTTKGIVICASHTPGSYTQIDTVRLTVLIF